MTRKAEGSGERAEPVRTVPIFQSQPEKEFALKYRNIRCNTLFLGGAHDGVPNVCRADQARPNAASTVGKTGLLRLITVT